MAQSALATMGLVRFSDWAWVWVCWPFDGSTEAATAAVNNRKISKETMDWPGS